ncbi:hypothetical protein GPROT1_02468 [Gammaproteobacteria bacterium]|nr:hypothetical protein GPROT1_02468 [Gammaproteobacteria bacterium]
MPYHPTILLCVEALHAGYWRVLIPKKKAFARCEALDVQNLPNGCPDSLHNATGAGGGSQCSVTA